MATENNTKEFIIMFLITILIANIYYFLKIFGVI